MATTAALLILVLLVPAAPAAARGAETDPARRNLVVEAVEKASPAVVNVSTEEVVEQRIFRPAVAGTGDLNNDNRDDVVLVADGGGTVGDRPRAAIVYGSRTALIVGFDALRHLPPRAADHLRGIPTIVAG